MKEDASREIVLVGAGPSGVTAARALLERGLRVTLLDAGNLFQIPTVSRSVLKGQGKTEYSFSKYINDQATRKTNVSPKFFTELGSLINVGSGGIVRNLGRGCISIY